MELPGSPGSAGWSGKHAVELYVRTYTTMLQSSGDIKVESLVQAHLGMGSVLHPLAAAPQVDMGALLYAVRRLPEAINRCRNVIMGQSPQGFRAVLHADILSWDAVKAPARRRRWYHDGKNTLAVLIASASDIDDLVPTLVAFQIEWNKLHRALQDAELSSEQARQAAGASEDDWRRLRDAWGDGFESNLAAIKRDECRVVLRLIGGSHLGYDRNASRWWLPIAAALDGMGARDAQVYFVSSNAHSLVNVLTGVARQFEDEIVDWISRNDRDLDSERRKLEAGHSRASRHNWLYYGARQVFDSHPERERLRKRRAEMEAANGVRHIPARGTGVDSAAQVFMLSRLDASAIDPRVGAVDEKKLRESDACILNVDYPLGQAAYHILRQVAEQASWIAGVYVLGKAATLNADVGDVMIPNVVHNEHSGNTYWLNNCFTASDVQPNLVYGSALDNQRAVAVRGTFLQNRDYLDFYYQGRYTVVEMEAGPYLDACYEIVQPDRYPLGESVNMAQVNFDLGIVHYASDTPYTQARTLGARGLSYRGMDSTYASAIAVARRILQREGALLPQS
ncbi:MAG TPA: hypothetical protein VJT78_12175 [Candidatus Dormibacteraeota bacterium]|nr:hypothetical protein [Candidatus Dormibacteraeota bacterium]